MDVLAWLILHIKHAGIDVGCDGPGFMGRYRVHLIFQEQRSRLEMDIRLEHRFLVEDAVTYISYVLSEAIDQRVVAHNEDASVNPEFDC